MPTSSVIFSPEMDERQLDSEVSKIDESLDDADTTIHPEIDESALDGFDGLGGGGGGVGGLSAARGGGAGGGAAAGAIAGLSSKLPASVSAGTAGAAAAAAALPVALAGGGFFALKNIEQGLAEASPALSQVNTMFSQAIKQFRAPFGRALAEELRPGAQTLLEAGVEFRKMASEQGLQSAIENLNEGFFGDIREEMVTRGPNETVMEDIIDDVTAAGKGGAVLGGIFGGQIGAQLGGAIASSLTLVMEPLLQPLNQLTDFTDDPFDALDIGIGDLVDPASAWNITDIIDPLNVWSVTDVISSATIGPQDLISGKTDIGPMDLLTSPISPLGFVGSIVEGTITGGMVLDEFLGGGGGGGGTGTGDTPGVNIANDPIDVRVQNFPSGPLRDQPVRPPDDGGGGGDGGFFDNLLGGGLDPDDLDYIESLLFDIRSELRDLNRQDSDFYVDGEQFARATANTRQDQLYDTDVTL
jgi:hypothetical protein